ncbi:hypothetical protein E3N88_05981 [Mikania micrantha]|uniref:Uncharacterized protein n=1 Tax=Mikania micrantha TaxID=192012 RepID=A0A5N6PPC2_9ASTR|nr:hypothetical protein E3N88_05981 [Mikania micrantha]
MPLADPAVTEELLALPAPGEHSEFDDPTGMQGKDVPKINIPNKRWAFQVMVMLFGWKNAPVVFMNHMNRGCILYLDQIIISTKDGILIHLSDKTEREQHIRDNLEL